MSAPTIRNLADLRRALTLGRKVQTHYYPDGPLARALGDRGDPPVRAVVKVQTNAVVFEACEWSKGRVSWLTFHKASGYIFDGSARVVVRTDDGPDNPPAFEYTILGDA